MGDRHSARFEGERKIIAGRGHQFSNGSERVSAFVVGAPPTFFGQVIISAFIAFVEQNRGAVMGPGGDQEAETILRRGKPGSETFSVHRHFESLDQILFEEDRRQFPNMSGARRCRVENLVLKSEVCFAQIVQQAYYRKSVQLNGIKFGSRGGIESTQVRWLVRKSPEYPGYIQTMCS